MTTKPKSLKFKIILAMSYCLWC